MTAARLTVVGEEVAARRRTLKRQTKLDAITEAASALFNENGIAAVSLSDVAERAGVGRATLYHYVDDRADLVFQCFQRTCALDAERLVTVEDETGGGLNAVLRYFEWSLKLDGPPTAVITDLGFMSAEARSIIFKSMKRNHQAMVHLITQGVSKSEIRPCDERIVAHAITSMVSYIRMAPRWVDVVSHPLDTCALAEALRFGALVDPPRSFVCPFDADAFSRLKAATFDRGSLGDMRVEQILMTASRLFNERGVEEVSLDAIAGELGATRGAVYHYFADKEELVRRCADRAHDLFEQFIAASEQFEGDASERLSIISHLNSQAQAGTLQPLASWIGLDAFSPKQRLRHQQRLRSLLRRTVALAEQSIAAGKRRPLDPSTLAVARAGAFTWIPRWTPRIEDTNPMRIADELTALFNYGLAAR